MAVMGHDEFVTQNPISGGPFNSSGWSVNFGSGSASATGSPSGLGGLLAGIDPLLLVGGVLLIWYFGKGK